MINKEKWKRNIRAILSLDSHPGHIAAGLAVGVFIGFTPFFSLHTVLAIAAAFILRLNKLTCVTGAWVNTPLTVVPVLAASYKIGLIARGLPPQEFHFKSLQWIHLKSHAATLIIGSSILGFAAALFSYALCYWLIVRFRKKDETLATLTDEMEEMGEDLE